MTLEDFFTLTEIKNGLTTRARVEELIYVMQEQLCATNNAGDVARQRSTAASILASTQNMECLGLFVHLSGLGFLNHWLQEAVQCSGDLPDGEELINMLLRSLDKLPVDSEKLRSFGILETVEKLFGHANANIKERARMLFEKWNNITANDSCCCVESLKPYGDAPFIESKHTREEADYSSCQAIEEGSCKVETGGNLSLDVTNNDDLHLGDANDVKCSMPNQTFPALSDDEKVPVDTVESSEIQVKDDDSSCASGKKAVSLEGDKEFRETTTSVPCSSTSHTKTLSVVRSASCNVALEERKPLLSDSKEALHRCASVDRMLPEFSKSMKVESAEHDSIDSPDSNKESEKAAAVFTADSESSDESNEPALSASEGVGTLIYDGPSRTLNDRGARKMRNGSDSESESVEIDALEIARQVAIEVEREVVDYREELCSSSSEASSIEDMNTTNLSIEDGQASPYLVETNGNEFIRKDDGDVFSSLKHDDHSFEEMVAMPPKPEQNMGATAIQESRGSDKIGKFEFDLNEDACDEDAEFVANSIHPTNTFNSSAPIAVSASKGAPGFLITPLCFETGLGWRGSASTSAFRPASSRRALYGERIDSTSKYNPNLIELDLNMTTGGEIYFPLDTASSIKEAPASSSKPSWDSSSEVSSTRAERMILDLNHNGEEPATLSPSPFINHRFVNGGGQFSSPSFDLNDNLLLSDVSASKTFGNPSMATANDASVISIMGSRMPFERSGRTNESHWCTNQAHPSYIGNGLSFDSAFMSRPTLHYNNNNNNLQMPPSAGYDYMGQGIETAFPFQPAAYGPPLSTLPFLMTLTGPPSGSDSVGPSQPALDLNFGMMPIENGICEAGNLTHPLFIPGHAGLREENSANSLKRKEPDSGWEPYSFGYKHLASWH